MKKQYISLTVVLIFLLLRPCIGQRVEYSGVYAPSDDWVKPSERPYRQDICLNGLWQFQPESLPAAFKEGVDPVPDLPSAGKRGWEKTPIRIPSPWNVNSFADKNGQGGDFRCYPGYPKEWENIKMGWLQKKFVVPADWKGKDILLHFEAVAGDAEIIINGKPAGHHFGIFLPFDIDVTALVLSGKENEIQVGIRKASLFDHRSEYGRRTYQAGSFWGQHIAGIWQDVYLVAVPQISVSDVYIRPLLDEDKLVAEVTVSNSGDRDREILVGANAYPWTNKKGKDGLAAPVPELASSLSLRRVGADGQGRKRHAGAKV